MRTLKLALRGITGARKGQLGKIIFLGAGFAAGLILLTKVWFEFSYEDFYPDTDRIYVVGYSLTTEDSSFGRELTPGGIVPTMSRNFPQIEIAGRYTWLNNDAVFYSGNRQRLKGDIVLADEYVFEILPRPMVQGNAGEVLSKPMYAMVSTRIASMMDGDPVGQTIELESHPGKVVTIGGVFEDIPENSDFRFDVAVSLSSIGSFMWDGTQILMGNDRYFSFVKVFPGTDMVQLQSAVDTLVEGFDEVKEISDWGWEFRVTMTPLRDIHKNSEGVKRTTLLLLILALAIISATVFNYLLVVLSDTMSRGRTIAVLKCHGAGFREIAGIVLAETFLQLLLLMVTAGVAVFLFRDTAQQLLGTSLQGLISWKSCLMLFGVMSLILLLSTYVQGRIYGNIPVATVFRNYRGTGRKVKLSLLFVQIAAAAFLSMLLVTVIRQYDLMLNDDTGYTYDNLLVYSAEGVDPARRNTILMELESLDPVERVSLGSNLPIWWPSGNNVWLPGEEKELFNVADFEYADENFLSVFGIQISEGRDFSRGYSRQDDMMVSRSFVEKMQNFVDWSDGIVGKSIMISGYEGEHTITGVYENFRISAVGNEDHRPSVLFYSETYPDLFVIKVKEVGPEAISKVQDALNKMLPEREPELWVYSEMLLNKYSHHLKFRNSIGIASVIVIIIVLVGLIGYVIDETTRREKEIAIRKINGATVGEVLSMLIRDILKMMAPAIVGGAVAAYFVAGKWMQEFSVKVSFDVFIALLCAIALAAIALTAVVLSALRIARKNPAQSIKSE